MPHGCGHHREGLQLPVAQQHAWVSINDLTDEAFIDQVSGTSALKDIALTVVAAEANRKV